MTEVSFVRCRSYDSPELETAVRMAVELLGGMSRFVKEGQTVLLKPNLLSAREPEKRVTTDPAVVKAVARLVLEAGGRPFIGDSPALDGFGRVAVKTGMTDIARELEIETIELRDSIPVTTPEGSIFKRLEIARVAMEADVVVNLPKLKTHSQMYLTLGVKNLFGTIVAQRKAEWHFTAGLDRRLFASLHLDIFRTVKPALTILDGVWGMEGYGPANGKPKHMGMIGAAEDAVALDTTVCRLLGASLQAFPLYQEARARGIGQTDISLIRCLGDPPYPLPDSIFQMPVLDAVGFLPEAVNRLAGRHLISRPGRDKSRCSGCGQCGNICPAEAIQMSGKDILFDYDRCIRCYCCQEICPEDAIRFKRGFIVKAMNWFGR